VASAGLLVAWFAFRSPSGRSAMPLAGPSSVSPSSEPNDESSPPPAPEFFIASTYQEGDSVVMPVTFPDGTRMKLVYPPSLHLAELGINPNTYGAGPGGCGGNLLIRAFDARHQMVEGVAPIATFPTPAGGRAELWPAKWPEWPSYWLVLQFGRWQVLVWCTGSEERSIEGAERWASSLEGRETGEGFLVLTGRPPLELAEMGDFQGPELFIEGGFDDSLLVLAPVQQCTFSERGNEWCIEGQPTALVVTAHGDDAQFIQSVVDGLEIRDGTDA
jgi:hypothetical protein